MRHWIMLVLAGEFALLFFNRSLVCGYLVIAGLFGGALGLRVVRLYPGRPEPLMLDASAVLLALLFSLFAGWLSSSPWRLGIIPFSSLIILPHLVYIVRTPSLK